MSPKYDVLLEESEGDSAGIHCSDALALGANSFLRLRPSHIEKPFNLLQMPPMK